MGRRMEPQRRRMLRNAVPNQPDEFVAERDIPEIYSRPRERTKEYDAFRKAGSKRRGTFTASETGARQMAVEGEISRLKEAGARDAVQHLRNIQEAKRQKKGRMT